jgi:hypothetical protein
MPAAARADKECMMADEAKRPRGAEKRTDVFKTPCQRVTIYYPKEEGVAGGLQG